MSTKRDLETIAGRREIEDLAREKIKEKARAAYWKVIAREDRLAENERRIRLGMEPHPLPDSLKD